MARLVVHIDEHPDCRVLRLDGELDVQTKADFVCACTGLLEDGQANIVVDTSRLSFCDCSSLRAMITTQRPSDAAAIYG
jgi:anti-anti-sigma factor